MTTEMRPVIDAVLDDATWLIRKDGWTRAADRDPDRRFWIEARTLSEAIEIAVPWDGETPRAVTDFLRARLGTDDLDAWNEADGRTVADVIAALRPTDQS